MGKRSPLRQVLRQRMRLAAERAKHGGGSRVSIAGRAHVVTSITTDKQAAMTAATSYQESPLVQGAAETIAPDDGWSGT